MYYLGFTTLPVDLVMFIIKTVTVIFISQIIVNVKVIYSFFTSLPVPKNKINPFRYL